MATKRGILTILLLMTLSVCTAPQYVPKPSEIGLNYRGAYITINTTASEDRTVSGELIAVEPKEIIVLTGNDPGQGTVAVRIDQIEKYKLKYARSTKFDWAIPLFSLFTISHGWYAFITMPTNIIATSFASSSGRFKYGKQDLPINRLGMFARFPQGIPEGVDMDSIE